MSYPVIGAKESLFAPAGRGKSTGEGWEPLASLSHTHTFHKCISANSAINSIYKESQATTLDAIRWSTRLLMWWSTTWWSTEPRIAIRKPKTGKFINVNG
jgi:hypothetical protein